MARTPTSSSMIATDFDGYDGETMMINADDQSIVKVDNEIRCCRARFVDEETGAARSSIISEFVFVPAGAKVTSKTITDIIVNKWKLEPANMLINCDAGSMHPRALATKKLSSQPQFFDWMNQAKAQMLKTQTEEEKAEFNLDDPDVLKEQSNIVINQLIFQRLLTIFAAVLDAASLSNNWIFINRANPNGSSATGQYMLEIAMNQTSQRPNVVIIESMARLRTFTNEDSTNCLASLENLASKAISFDRYNKDEFEPVKYPANYDIEEFNDYRSWVDKDVPTVVHRDDMTAEGTVGERARWGYHYQSCLYTSGTHYIILDGDESSFPVAAMGNIGYVCAHGSTRAYQRLRSYIQAGKPIVMMNNTGGVCQAFSSLHRALMSAQDAGESPTAEEILDKIEIMNNVDQWTKTFGIPEIMMFRELMQRAPLLFQKTIVVVDLVKDSAEEVLSTVTGCFASSASGVPELGIGNAETAVVYNAWKRHLVLHTNKLALMKLANQLFIALVLFGLATSILSTVYANQIDVGLTSKDAETMNMFIIILPICSAFIGQVITRQRYTEKWKICDVAASMIVSEIYNFRASTSVYAAGYSASAEGEEGEEEENSGGGNHASKRRNLFVRRIQTIFAKVMDSDVGSSGALKYGSILRMNTDAGVESIFHKKHLKKHIEENLIFTKEREEPKGPMENLKGDSKIAVEQPHVKAADKFGGIEKDDFVSPITIETYVEYRAKPLALAYEKQTPVISRHLSLLEITTFVLTSAGAVFAVAHLGSWVAITVAASTAVTQTIEFYQFKVERDTRNASLAEFQNLLTWWESLSIIDKRTRQSKEKAVSTIENGALLLVERRSGGAFGASQGDDDGSSGDGEGGDE